MQNNLIYLLDKAQEKPLTQEEENLKKLFRIQSKFNESMDDDLNTADGLAVIFDMVRDINSNVKQNPPGYW